MNSSASGTLVYRRLRTPKQHGQTLVDPPLYEAPAVIERNAHLLACFEYDLQGRDLAAVRRAAREHLVAAALDYTRQYRSVEMPVADPALGSARLLVAGHQPELFHPGVWFKNVALARLAARQQATALNLIIDNDLARGTSIRSPAGGDENLHMVRIALDRPGGDIPYEQRQIVDPEMLQTFDRRVVEAISPWIAEPLVEPLWKYVRRAMKRSRLLGQVLAEARHCFEAHWGLQSLELPLSQLCDGPQFQWFACHLLAHLPRLHRDYNEALHQYRQLHRIRSRSHPVADLTVEGEWCEAPLWIWTDERPQRRPMFVRQNGRQLQITDRKHVRLVWPLYEDGDAAGAVEAWQAARREGIKIRPRALMTTMFARLALGDLFLHGIGGAKYDQLTDEIMRRFFRCEPPTYMTLSATILLPVHREDVQVDDVRHIDHLLRELQYHPEKHAPATPQVQQLAAEKQQWLSDQPPDEDLRARHLAIGRINEALQSWVQPLREKLLVQREELVQRLRHTQLLASREFSFCLFPESTLRHLLLDLATAPP